MKNNDVKSMCMMFKSGPELSNFLLEHKIHLFFVEGVDGVGKTSLLNEVGIHYTHFPTVECPKTDGASSPFDYAIDIVSTVYGKVKEAAVERLEKYPALDSVNLYFDRGFMSTLAYAPTIIQEYMTTHEPYYYYRTCAWDYGQDMLFEHAVERMIKEFIKDPDNEWFARVWSQFVNGLLQCPYVHIVYLPSYDSHGLVERIKQRGLAEDMRMLETIGETGIRQQLEERLEAYDFMRLLFSTLPMVCHRHDKEIEGEFVRLFITKDEFKRVVNNDKNKPAIKHGHLIETPLSITF